MDALRMAMGLKGARALLAVLVLAGAGCFGRGEKDVASSGDPEADRRAEMRVEGDGGKGQAARTLYDRLGGTATIERIVEDMTERVMADPRVNFERREIGNRWLGTRPKPWEPSPEHVTEFKKHMVEFLTLAAGGPVEYSGRDLKAVHKGMRITNSEFDAMVGDIKTTLDRMGMAAREKKEFLAIVETTRKQIVEK